MFLHDTDGIMSTLIKKSSWCIYAFGFVKFCLRVSFINSMVEFLSSNVLKVISVNKLHLYYNY